MAVKLDVKWELNSHQKAKKVTIVEIAEDILMAPSFVANKQNIRYMVEHSLVHVLTSCATKEIKEKEVIVELNGNQEVLKSRYSDFFNRFSK